MRTANLTLEYTNDNEPLALKEVESILKNIDGIEEILFLEVIKSRRACRNSYRKELSEEQFDVLEFDEEEAWFDDYDFTLFGQIKTSLSPKDLLTKCNNMGLSIDEKLN